MSKSILLFDQIPCVVCFSLPDPPAFQGVLQQNERLHSSERLFEGKVRGAESIVKDGGMYLLI